VDQRERIDVSGVVAEVALGSEVVNTSVSFLLYGVAELEALEWNERVTSTHEILSAVAARLVATAAADQAHQRPGYAAGPIWTAHSLLHAARTLADLHVGCDVRQWLASTSYWDPCEEAIKASDPMESASGSAAVAASTGDGRARLRHEHYDLGKLPSTTCGPWRMRTWRSQSCRGRLPHRTMSVV